MAAAHSPDTLPWSPPAQGRDRYQARAALARWCLATLGAVGFLVTYAVAVLTPRGQRLDTAWMEWATGLARGDRAQGLLLTVVELAGPGTMMVLATGCGLAALARGMRSAAAVATVVVICMAGSQVLKAGLPRPQLGATAWDMPNSLPSGHTAAVAAVAVALVLLVPLRLRLLTLVLGALATAGMGVVVTILAYHRPSDALASGFLALAALGAGLLIQDDERRGPVRAARPG